MDTTICFLAANKCDSESREVDEVEARLWAELHGFIYCETSANTGLGITDMFQVRLTLTENVTTRHVIIVRASSHKLSAWQNQGWDPKHQSQERGR